MGSLVNRPSLRLNYTFTVIIESILFFSDLNSNFLSFVLRIVKGCRDILMVGFVAKINFVILN